MAIQNFLSGGYYGKLGATVGQRWKNKRTIRTYVVPKNPRTPTQQANRNKFANAVMFAQMGMQMNYYCTLFDDLNYTKWNYRMKVARELKNAGLSDLDLIPLYPTSFTPPILLTEFTKRITSGQKHISFAAPGLTLNNDRVLSLMFALYNEQDEFLGYKLYLGYYYASNPGYVEVDVDDINEINEHCFVRIISNDDENSTVDLIGSQRIAVKDSPLDIHTFNKTIRILQKNTAGVTITFEEPWKGVPTINEISFNLICVINGEKITLNGAGCTLFEDNGYCAVTLEHASIKNQMLPAFPLGSGLADLTVNYEGENWKIGIKDASEAYEDSDLERSFISTISSISRSGTTFSVIFDEILPTVTTRNLTLAIRSVKNGVWVNENVTIANVANNTITFEQSGASGADIYAFPNGATITFAGTITGNGVTYTADTQTAQNVSNTDLNRSILSSPVWNASSTDDIRFYIPFNGAITGFKTNFNMVCSGRIALRTEESQSFYIEATGNNIEVLCTGSRKKYPMLATGDQISVTEQNFICNGVTYIIPAQNVALRNAIRTSNFLEELKWEFRRNGGGSTGNILLYLDIKTRLNNALHKSISGKNEMPYTYVEIIYGIKNCIPNESEYSITQLEGNLFITFRDYYDGSENDNETQDSSNVVVSSNPTIIVDGITYELSTQWLIQHYPSTLGEWKV